MSTDEVQRSARSVLDKGGEVAGQAQDAFGKVKNAATSGADSIDISGLRDEVGKLGQSIASLVKEQATGVQGRVAGAASMAQDRASSLEADMRPRIQENPWAAVGIAAVIGFLFAKIV